MVPAVGLYLIQIALLVFVLTLAVRLVRAVESIERSVARAVTRYERNTQ